MRKFIAMKIQDVSFFLIFVTALDFKNFRLSAGLGIICLLLAVPLFAKWIFFTAERLTWYAAAFFLLAIAQIWWEAKHAHRN